MLTKTNFLDCKHRTLTDVVKSGWDDGIMLLIFGGVYCVLRAKGGRYESDDPTIEESELYPGDFSDEILIQYGIRTAEEIAAERAAVKKAHEARERRKRLDAYNRLKQEFESQEIVD